MDRACQRCETRCLALEVRISYEKRQYHQLRKEMEALRAHNYNRREEIGERHRLLESARASQAAERSQFEANLATTTRDLRECESRLPRCAVFANLRRVERKAQERMAAADAEIAILGGRVRELESKDEDLLRRREELLLDLSEPIPTTEMEDTLWEEAMKNIEIYEASLRRVLSLPLNDSEPEEERLIARLERSNLRRRKLIRPLKKASIKTNSMQFDRVTVNRRPLEFGELKLSDRDIQCHFDRLIVRRFRYESSCQETDRMTQYIKMYCARMQTEFTRKRAKLRELQAIKELSEQVRVAYRDVAARRRALVLIRKKKNSMNDDKRELNRSVVAMKSSKETLEQLRFAANLKEDGVAEREEAVVQRRKLVEELRRELEDGFVEFEMLHTRTERLEAEAIAVEGRIRAIHTEGRLCLQAMTAPRD
jgi:hypothetical protein